MADNSLGSMERREIRFGTRKSDYSSSISISFNTDASPIHNRFPSDDVGNSMSDFDLLHSSVEKSASNLKKKKYKSKKTQFPNIKQIWTIEKSVIETNIPASTPLSKKLAFLQEENAKLKSIIQEKHHLKDKFTKESLTREHKIVSKKNHLSPNESFALSDIIKKQDLFLFNLEKKTSSFKHKIRGFVNQRKPRIEAFGEPRRKFPKSDLVLSSF